MNNYLEIIEILSEKKIKSIDSLKFEALKFVFECEKQILSFE